ncbi:DEAD/DEAH box helicase [Streptomyces sp. NPDC056165]|uniref:DEAD/DEAH box helicase n=1 Tax=Streptomyces sp. NPDC056165 TaxID=3345733 RepID=UPI0035DE3848
MPNTPARSTSRLSITVTYLHAAVAGSPAIPSTSSLIVDRCHPRRLPTRQAHHTKGRETHRQTAQTHAQRAAVRPSGPTRPTPRPRAARSWWDEPRLAVYVVPTRALAAQVERHLAESLELVGLRVSALFGGTEYVRYETQLLDYTDVLVVTSEKLDLLLRHMPDLSTRLALVLVDEGHQLDVSERGLRLRPEGDRQRRPCSSAPGR